MTILKKMVSNTNLSSTFSSDEMTVSYKTDSEPTIDKDLAMGIMAILKKKTSYKDLQNIYKLIIEHKTRISFTQDLSKQIFKERLDSPFFKVVLSHLIVLFFKDINEGSDQSSLISLIDTINRERPETYHYFMTAHHRLCYLEPFMQTLFRHCHNEVYASLKTPSIIYGIKELTESTIPEQKKRSTSY